MKKVKLFLVSLFFIPLFYFSYKVFENFNNQYAMVYLLLVSLTATIIMYSIEHFFCD